MGVKKPNKTRAGGKNSRATIRTPPNFAASEREREINHHSNRTVHRYALFDAARRVRAETLASQEARHQILPHKIDQLLAVSTSMCVCTYMHAVWNFPKGRLSETVGVGGHTVSNTVCTTLSTYFGAPRLVKQTTNAVVRLKKTDISEPQLPIVR